MLEHSFTCLDDDYITLWSKFIINESINTDFFDYLTSLAELGQINAIQSWYLLAKKDDSNPIIESQVPTETFFSPNINLVYSNYYNHEGSYDVASDFFVTAKTQFLDFYEKYLNPLFAERYLELSLKHYPHGSKSNPEPHEIADFSLAQFLRIRSELSKKLRKDPTNSSLKFALGKNMVLFKDCINLPSLKRTSKKGLEILTELANRPLSQELQAYNTERMKTKCYNPLFVSKFDENTTTTPPDGIVEDDVLESLEYLQEYRDITYKRVNPNEKIGSLFVEKQ